MRKVLIIGASGEIGSEIEKQLEQEMSVIPTNRKTLDLGTNEDAAKIVSVMNEHDPDFIVNCAGIFGNNEVDFNQIYDVNVRITWDFIKYFMSHQPSKPVRYIAIGSSAYKSGRRDYMLYSSSKAALVNLIQGAQEYFDGSKFSLSLVNLPGVNSKMRNKAKNVANSSNLMTVEMAANKVIELGFLHELASCWDLSN